MILALETGWTPDVLVDLPGQFRRASHWTLYARTLVGDDGLQEIDVAAVSREHKAEAARAAMANADVRKHLFPEDD